ncbi:MAG TPA: hypothetical protein VMF70_08220, partial [Gemmatimonadales bacterium]|nr:hypothetical protein [Gemmatimonadales bacterium]
MGFTKQTAKAAGAKGRQAAAANRRSGGSPQPYPFPFSGFLELAGMAGPSWRAAVTLWKAADAEPLSEDERALFARHAGGRALPARPV